ncbi:phosphatidylinositol glycan anchor biosynthesis class U protein-like [Acanthaster planci]|uniref:Phosphatidylinositol glycan anchor biosynthesis class U protein-like n=1 Tax=Acanthaster planci TaxID=133434 RepID=A0A8B7XN08_ACAPL|nr:phosphatidylinositol glycan anchor biosynthesis class U protein-like [Acanthaster planci]
MTGRLAHNVLVHNTFTSYEFKFVNKTMNYCERLQTNECFKMAAPMLFTIFLGVAVRIVLFNSSLASWLAERVEISTPLTSWKSVIEGITLLQNGISPYAGDVFHETPFVLYFFHHLLSASPRLVPVVFVLLDLITAWLLYAGAGHCLKYLLLTQSKESGMFSKDADRLLIKKSDIYNLPRLVASIYLLNPYTVVTCVGQSTLVMTHLAVAAVFLFTTRGYRLAAAFALAAATYQSLYPAMMVVPCAMHLVNLKAQARSSTVSYLSPPSVKSYLTTAVMFLFWLGCLHGLSFLMLESWDFLFSTYGCILMVPNLTPNMGLFWYFFTEMFEHFRYFFLWVYQINVFIYTAPLAIKLRKHPLFMMYIQCIIMAIFKSYPAFGDTSVYLALLPVWSHAFYYLRNTLVVGVMFVLSSVLAPILWQLWIYSGSANANFFFAFTLVYNTAQIFLATDVLYAFLKREFALIHGMKPVDKDGNAQQAVLQ